MWRRVNRIPFNLQWTCKWSLYLNSHDSSDLWHILSSTATHVDNNILIGPQSLGKLDCIVNGVTSLQSRNNSLVFTHHLETLKCLVVRYCVVFSSPNILQVGVLRSDSRV